MGNIVGFPPPAWPGGQVPVTPLSRAALRAQLEEAAQIALDAADRILATLDRMGKDADHVGNGNAERNLGSPKVHDGQRSRRQSNITELAVDAVPVQKVVDQPEIKWD